jgi:modulator of FtsH protease
VRKFFSKYKQHIPMESVMQPNQPVIVKSRQESILATHAVLRNTYLLLSLTLLFSAVTAGFTMAYNVAAPGVVLFLLGMFGLSYLVSALRNSPFGILAAFAFTGFMGYALGPILNMFLHSYANGSQIIMTALGGTGFIFLTLSAYVLTTRKDFSYLGGFLFAGVMIAFLTSIAAMLFHMPMLQVMISGVFALLSSGLILFHTSQIIHGGERNYIMATVSIYVALFNLFVSLLNILGVFSGSRD